MTFHTTPKGVVPVAVHVHCSSTSSCWTVVQSACALPLVPQLYLTVLSQLAIALTHVYI